MFFNCLRAVVFFGVLGLTVTQAASLGDESTTTFKSLCDRSVFIQDYVLYKFRFQNIKNCKQVKAKHLEEFDVLYLGNKRISNIKPYDFEDFINVKVLSLEKNFLAQLPEQVLAPLRSLEEVNLQSNQLEVLPEQLFAYNVGLTKVNSEDNKLERFPVSLFANNQKLKTVVLAKNQLTELDVRHFEKNLSLSTLDLSRNQIHKWPVGLLQNIRTMDFLDLSHNDLSGLDEDFFGGKSRLRGVYRISSLNMHHGQLERLPEFLFSHLWVEALSLAHNEIEVLPSDMVSHTAIQWLDLKNNKIRSIPEGFFDGIHSMSSILLNNNMISSLPEGLFTNFSKLGRLDLSANRLLQADKVRVRQEVPFDTHVLY